MQYCSPAKLVCLCRKITLAPSAVEAHPTLNPVVACGRKFRSDYGKKITAALGLLGQRPASFAAPHARLQAVVPKGLENVEEAFAYAANREHAPSFSERLETAKPEGAETPTRSNYRKLLLFEASARQAVRYASRSSSGIAPDATIRPAVRDSSRRGGIHSGRNEDGPRRRCLWFVTRYCRGGHDLSKWRPCWGDVRGVEARRR